MSCIDDLWEYYDLRKKEGADKTELQTIRFCIGWLVTKDRKCEKGNAMGKYQTHVDRWVSWDELTELESQLDALKEEVLTDVKENALKDKPKKAKKTSEKA